MEQSKDLENRIAPSPQQGAVDPTITVVGPRVTWREKKLDADRKWRTNSGPISVEKEDRGLIEEEINPNTQAQINSPSSIQSTPEKPGSPAFVHELVNKFSASENSSKSISELISMLSPRQPVSREGTKPSDKLEPQTSCQSPQSGVFQGIGTEAPKRKEERHENQNAKGLFNGVKQTNANSARSEGGTSELSSIAKPPEHFIPQKPTTPPYYNFSDPKSRFPLSEPSLLFPLSGKSPMNPLFGKPLGQEKESSQRTGLESLMLNDNQLWKQSQEQNPTHSKEEAPMTPFSFQHPTMEEFRFLDDPRKAQSPAPSQQFLEEYASITSPFPPSLQRPTKSILDLKFPLSDMTELKAEPQVQFTAPSTPIIGVSIGGLPSLASSSLQFIEGNMPSQMFELAEQPMEIQRKCYKKENRCLLPNPLQIILKREFLQAANYILDGVVSVKLVTIDGKELGSEKQNMLQSVDEGLKHSLDLAKGTNFSLKVLDTTDGTNVRLLFTITYRIRGNRICEEKVLSDAFEVCSNSKRKRKLTSQLQQQKAESSHHM